LPHHVGCDTIASRNFEGAEVNMAILVVPVATCVALILISVVAAVLLPANARLPMQWNQTGKPIWYASKLLAIGFIPALAIVVFAAALAPIYFSGAPSIPLLDLVLIGIASIFLIVHIAHMWLSLRYVRRQAR
jgi:hypothetical protein